MFRAKPQPSPLMKSMLKTYIRVLGAEAGP